MKRLLIVGCGYVGLRVARRAVQSGQQVFALTRGRARFDELRMVGVEPIDGHWLDHNQLQGLPRVEQVLVAVPHRADELGSAPPATDEAFSVATHARGLKHLLTALPPTWSKLCYLSTTGVYGCDSQTWVDESTPVSPKRIGPQIAVAAEHWLEQQLAPERFTVLRLAGIYGPGRIPLADKLRRGEPLEVPRQGYVNLVHVEDIARMIEIVLSRQLERLQYIFSDGCPVLREVLYRRMAELCGVHEPSFVEPAASDSKARRATDKRVSPARLVQETGYEYQFPDTRSGLVDALGRR